MTASIYDIALTHLDGEPGTLAEYRGQVLLVVNVASKCGLTPQYSGLEALYECLRERGLQVLGFPCNDFAAQEPGSEAEIQAFCDTTYDVKFPLFAKLRINSAPRHPLYAALIAAQPQAQPSGSDKLRSTLAQHKLLPAHDSDVMWNFEKFLVGRDGAVLARFAPDVTQEDPALVAAVESALGTGSGQSRLQPTEETI
jgi:glutathione peroxidase